MQVRLQELLKLVTQPRLRVEKEALVEAPMRTRIPKSSLPLPLSSPNSGSKSAKISATCIS